MELLPVEIAEAFERGATVVTGNQRAARSLRLAFDRRNRQLGLKSWRPPAILAWDTWIADLWRGLLIEGHASQLLLNRTQEHAVWRGVLAGDTELRSLRSQETLADMAADAWRLLCSYNGQARLQRASVSADTRAFQRWARAFQRRCMAEGFLPQAQLEEALRGAVETEKSRLGAGGIALVGFDAMTPAQVGLVEAVQAAGAAVTEVRFAVPVEQRLLFEAEQEDEELTVAARWIRGFLEAQPEARVAVIVPGLEEQRTEIDRVFREVLAPELQSIEARGEAGPYEFSIGVALAETPMCAAALDLLRWATSALPLERVSALLLSPYFGATGEERSSRAEFDAFDLRKARVLRPEVSLDWLIRLAEVSKRRSGLGGLRGVLRAMRSAAGMVGRSDRRTHAEWGHRMGEFLHAAGWGARAGEDSVEFQTRRKWDSVLDELATLDFDGGQVEFGRALEGLERIARQTMFAPESREAPVQVMGPLEAAGATFDAVWFLRAGDLTWPMMTGSTPLLPWQLKSDLGMPGTDMARDSDHARRMTERIAASAGTAVFSYARETGEGTQRRSPVLEGLELEEVGVVKLVAPEVERAVVEVETIEDTVRIQPPPDRVMKGGAKVLELQAACGFRAFAEQRLWATELETAELGMDARESGIVVHRVLEYFWGEVKTQAALKKMLPAEQAALLDQCIVRALRQTEELSSTPWDEAYVVMQHERLRRLLEPWLAMEKTERSPFEVKLSEKNFDDVHIGPLRLNVRVDRVDEVDGGMVLIDYKTGRAAPSDWLSERPDAPQLPLYAVLAGAENLQGVAFGLVRAGEELELKGYATGDGVLPKKTKLKAASLQAQVEDWQRVLERLATEFYAGEARVAPKRYPKTCEHCSQRILCRLDVSSLGDDDLEEDGAVAEEDRG